MLDVMIVQRKGSVLSNICYSNQSSSGQISASESCQRATQTPNLKLCNYHICCPSNISSTMKCTCSLQDSLQCKVHYCSHLKQFEQAPLHLPQHFRRCHCHSSAVVSDNLCSCTFCPQNKKSTLLKHRYCLQRYILSRKQMENPSGDLQSSKSSSCHQSSLQQNSIIDQLVDHGRICDKNQIIIEIDDALRKTDVTINNEDLKNVEKKSGDKDKEIVRLSLTNSLTPNRASNENLFNSQIDLNLIPFCCQLCHMNSHSIALLYDATQMTAAGQHRCKRSISNSVGDYLCTCSQCCGCCCALHVHTASCTSMINSLVELRQNPELVHRRAFIVSAECHRSSSMSQESNESYGNSKDESIKSSRCSSMSRSTSFCSCNSSSYCYCGGSCADSSIEHMHSLQKIKTTKEQPSLERNNSGAEDDQNSSTLTPPTNPSSLVSTPLTEYDDLNTQTANKSYSDDTSSLSQSAEYYSLSSSTQPSHSTPKKATTQAGNPEEFTQNETATLSSYL